MAHDHRFKVTSRREPRPRSLFVRKANAALDLAAFTHLACKAAKVPEEAENQAHLLTQDGERITNVETLLRLRSPTNLIHVCLEGENYQRDRAQHLVQQLRDLNLDPEAKNMVVADFLDGSDSSKAKASTIEEDPDWFMDTKGYKTKEAYMRERARSRVTNYLYATKTYVDDVIGDKDTPCSEAVAGILKKAVNDLKLKLRECNFFRSYFDRKSDHRFCDKEGNFHCQGIYNENTCRNKRVINPYKSRQERCDFTNWQFDHVIEKRSILPSLIKAAEKVVEEEGRVKVNIGYFFDLLFTKKNLKLVERGCHLTTLHSDKECEPKMITCPI